MKLYFEKVVESHAVLRNNTKIPGASLIQLPQWLHLAKTIIQYHNQDIDIDTIQIQYISITTKIPHRSFAPLQPNPLPFYPFPLLDSSQPLFSISVMLSFQGRNKWNHTLCNFLGLTFLTQHNSLEINSLEIVSYSSSWFFLFLLLNSIPYG